MKPEDLEPYCASVWSEEYAAYNRQLIAELPFPVEGMSVLDLAGGPGAFSGALVAAGAAEVVWQDIEPIFARVASDRIQSDRVKFEVRDMMDLPYPDARFDAVFLLEAMHWAAHEGVLLRRLGQLLRTDGWLVITAPNFRRAFERERPLRKILGHLASPVVAAGLGRKPRTTLWVWESLTRRRLLAAGMVVHRWRRLTRARFEVVARKTTGPAVG